MEKNATLPKPYPACISSLLSLKPFIMRTLFTRQTLFAFAFTIANLFWVGTAKAQLLQQSFTSALAAGNSGGGTIISNTGVTSDATYVAAAPSNTQFTYMGSSAATNSITIDGIDGLLKLARTGGSLAIVRNTTFTGSPTSLMVKFDFNCLTGGSSTSMAEFNVGSNFANSTSAQTTTNKHSLFYITVVRDKF